MENQGTNIFEGEAVETDDEDDYQGFMENTMVIAEPKTPSLEVPSSSVVVSGEAEESDEDTNDFITRADYPTSPKYHDDDEIVPLEAKRKFQSPFHKKLWERNFAFRLGVVESKLETFNHVISKLQSLVPTANRTQEYSQEALQNYRNISDTTKELHDQLEIILQTTELPNISHNFDSAK